MANNIYPIYNYCVYYVTCEVLILYLRISLDGSVSSQAAYMARLGELASDAEIVVWWSSRDLLPADIMTKCYNWTCGDDIWYEQKIYSFFRNNIIKC